LILNKCHLVNNSSSLLLAELVLIAPYTFKGVEHRKMLFASSASLSSIARADKLKNCINCAWRYLCGGGCRALALLSTGRIDGADPYCKFYKFYFEHALWGVWG
jgi:radical SAM protein with 4Fe4S-binding SPASM domain